MEFFSFKCWLKDKRLSRISPRCFVYSSEETNSLLNVNLGKTYGLCFLDKNTSIAYFLGSGLKDIFH